MIFNIYKNKHNIPKNTSESIPKCTRFLDLRFILMDPAFKELQVEIYNYISTTYIDQISEAIRQKENEFEGYFGVKFRIKDPSRFRKKIKFSIVQRSILWQKSLTAKNNWFALSRPEKLNKRPVCWIFQSEDGVEHFNIIFMTMKEKELPVDETPIPEPEVLGSDAKDDSGPTVNASESWYPYDNPKTQKRRSKKKKK